MRSSHTAAILLLVGFGACAKKPTARPPWEDNDCDGVGCDNPGRALGQGAGADAATGSASNSRDGAVKDAGESERASVEIDLRLAVDLETTSSEVFGSTVKVYQLDLLTTSTWQEKLVGEGTSGETSVSPSKQGTWFWLEADPNSQLLSSVVWLTPMPPQVTVPMFPRTLMEDLGAGLVNLPVVPNETMGHVVLRVVDDQGIGLATVGATALSGVVAYGVGGTGSDVIMQTGETGRIVWFNVPTGGARTLVLNYGSESLPVTVPVLEGSVTLSTVTWNPQMP